MSQPFKKQYMQGIFLCYGIYLKVFFKEIFIQQPEEPWQQYLGEDQHLNCYWYNQSSYFFCESSNIFYLFLFCKNVKSYHQVHQKRPRKHRIGEVLQGRSKFKRSNVSTATLFFGICWKTCSHFSIFQNLYHFWSECCKTISLPSPPTSI